MLKIEAVAQVKFIHTVDSTGMKLPQIEIDRQVASAFVGKVEIEIWTEKYALMRFKVSIINGKHSRFVAWPSMDIGRGEKGPAFEVGEEVKNQIEAVALRTMREAIQSEKSSSKATVEL